MLTILWQRTAGLSVLFLLVFWLYSSAHAQETRVTDTPTPTGATSIANPIPRSGDQKLLVVLVDFPDKAGLFSGQQWHETFFGPGGFSDYYQAVSYHQLRYSGDVVGIANGIAQTNSANVAYVRLPNPIGYYADGGYGFKVGVGQFPKNNAGVVDQALQALNNANFNFAPYANLLTNQVDNLVVVFAGSNFGYTRDPVNSLEATAFSLTRGGGSEFVSHGGQKVDNFTFCPDQSYNQSGQVALIGVCSHEHGHALGMPDLYDFSYTTAGVGYFDLMSFGLYGGQGGVRPFHYGAFSKAFFGWITPTVVLNGVNQVTLAPAEDGPNFLKLYPYGDTSKSEYFLIENRQPHGFDQDWTAQGLCPGLLIWHIDQNIVDHYLAGNLVNTQASVGGPDHPGVEVVEADGRYDLTTQHASTVPDYGTCSDLWQVGRLWDANSAPNSNLWDGSPSGLSVQVTGENNGVLTLEVRVDPITQPQFNYKSYLPLIRN